MWWKQHTSSSFIYRIENCYQLPLTISLFIYMIFDVTTMLVIKPNKVTVRKCYNFGLILIFIASKIATILCTFFMCTCFYFDKNVWTQLGNKLILFTRVSRYSLVWSFQWFHFKANIDACPYALIQVNFLTCQKTMLMGSHRQLWC